MPGAGFETCPRFLYNENKEIPENYKEKDSFGFALLFIFGEPPEYIKA